MAKTKSQWTQKSEQGKQKKEYNERELENIQEDTKEAVDEIQHMYEMPTAEDISMLSSLVSEFKYSIKSALNTRNHEAKVVANELQEDEEESKQAIKEVQENRTRIEQLNHLNNQYDQSIVNKMISENKNSEAFQDELKQEAIKTRRELSDTVTSVSNRVHSLLF